MTELDLVRAWINEHIQDNDKSSYDAGYNDALYDLIDMIEQLEDKLEHS